MMQKEVLLNIETDSFLITFMGPKPSQNSYCLKNFKGGKKVNLEKNEIYNVVYTSDEIFNKIPLFSVESTNLGFDSSSVRVELNTLCFDEGEERFLPVFFENIDYQVQLSPKQKESRKIYTLWHEHSSINNTLSFFKNHGTFSGTFNFRNNVGLSKFEVKEDGKTILCLIFTVFSIKIDYLIDRHLMIKELSDIHNSLLFEVFNPTKTSSTQSKNKASGLEWLNNFYDLSNNLLNQVQRIEKKSHNKLISEKKVQKVEKIKKPSRDLFKQINKFGKEVVLGRRSVEIESKKNDNNTPENQYIKSLVNMVLKVISKWIFFIKLSENESMKKLQQEYFFQMIELNQKKLKKIVKNQFWSNIDDNIESIKNKTNFLFHNEFLQLEKLVKRLRRGVKIQEDGMNTIHTVSMEDLYEYWTFCKLASIISGILFKDDKVLSLKVKSNAFRTILVSGQASKIRIEKGVSISTNRLFKTDITATYFSPLVSQKPDLVFEVENNNRLNIFDAKYKINIILKKGNDYKILSNKELISLDLSNYSDGEILFSPKDDDINTMHRYKDAIYTNIKDDTNVSVGKAVNKGIILYPHKPNKKDEQALNQYLNSLNTFKIGAIPLAPGLRDSDWALFNNEIIPNNSDEIEQVRILASQIDSILKEEAIDKV
jgi:uncharacterized protein